MKSSARSRIVALLRGQWAGLLALFLVIAGGTAYAANTVFSTDIVNGEVKTPDLATDAVNAGKIAAGAVATSEIANNQIRSADVRDDTLSDGGLTGLDIRAESIGTSEIADGTIRDADLAAPARGARAYGYVDGAHCDDAVAFCTVSRTKRVAYAVHVAGGQWCVGVDGIDPQDPSTLAVVTPATVNGDIVALWRQSNSLCMASEFEIQTGNAANFADASFSIVIP